MYSIPSDLVDFVRPVEAVIPGSQGRVLAVLAQTTAELNLRTIARLASVSVAQASRVLPGLVTLGIVERREVPPSSQFRLVRENVAARAVLELARSRDAVLERLRAAVAAMPLSPVCVIVFGSFARGDAGHDSDLDVLVLRPDSADDDIWTESLEAWRRLAMDITGNAVEVIDVTPTEARANLTDPSPLWSDIVRDGVTIYGSIPANCERQSMPKPTRTKPVSGAQVRAYTVKADEHVAAAANEVAADRYIATTSLAIHAAINAADAVCGARLGQRGAGDDHDRVLTLLGQGRARWCGGREGATTTTIAAEDAGGAMCQDRSGRRRRRSLTSPVHSSSIVDALAPDRRGQW